MKKLVLVLLASMSIASGAFTAQRVEFATFKFQPEKRYEMRVFHKSLLHFIPGEDTTVSEVKEKLSMENQILCNVVIETFPLTENNTIPMKMRFKSFSILLKSGGKSMSMPLPGEVLDRMEYIGELKETGEIRVIKRPTLPQEVQKRSFDLIKLMDLIPDFPEGSYAPGAIFHSSPGGRTLTAGESEDPEATKFTILKSQGNDVFISAEQAATSKTTQGNFSEETVLGSSGEMIYSLAERVCRSLRLDVKSNTVRKREPGGVAVGAMANDMHLEIDVKEAPD